VIIASAERAVRFSDTNLEIIRSSDGIVGLVRSGQMDAPGGTWQTRSGLRRMIGTPSAPPSWLSNLRLP